MLDNAVTIGLFVVAVVVLVVVVIALVVVLRRRARARDVEPVVRRIDLTSSSPSVASPTAPESDAAPAWPPFASELPPVEDPSRDTRPPLAPILHFDTIQLEPLPSSTSPAAPPSAAAPDADESVIVRDTGASSVPPVADATVLSTRRRSLWHLETQHGQRVPLNTAMCIIGRRPNPVATHPSAALISVDDPGKTVSGTHALFELIDDEWVVTDLDSTNGVVVVVGGFETAIPSRVRTRIDGDFFLGDLGVRFVRES